MVDLKELNPTAFYLYMDNPPLLDLVANCAIELNNQRMLKSTLQELSAVGEYTKLTCELDRFALWMLDAGLVSIEKMGARLSLNRDLNPVTATNPTSMMDIFKAVELCVERSNLVGSIKVKLIEKYADFFPLFNQTLLQ